jgi:hypothetical protein
MATFVLAIELGNDAMVSARDVAYALARVARILETDGTGYGPGAELTDDDSGQVRDVNGNSVGSWQVQS